MTAAILVTRLDNCGDVLLSGPTIRAARASGRPVHVLCGPRGRVAAELLPGIDRIIEWRAPWIDPDPMPVRTRDANRLVSAVGRLGVDDALILGSSHQSPLPLALLLRWAGVRRIAAVSHEHAGSLLDVRLRGDPDLHEVERNLLVATALGFPLLGDDRLQVDVAVDRADGAGRTVVLHPGASVPARTLAPARWRAIAAALARTGATVLVTGSGAEVRLTTEVAGQAPGVLDLGGKTTFRQLAGVIGRAQAFVGGNSGPMHLAAAMGTPTVAVFAPTVPLERWRPWKVPHVVLGHQDVACAGCRSHTCPLPRQVCLDGIDPDHVVEAMEAMLELAGAPAR